MTHATHATPAPAGPHHRTQPAVLFPPTTSLHARGLTGLLVRSSLAVAAWGERRAVRHADAALTRPARAHRRAVRGWADPTSDRERYASRRAAGHLDP